MSGQCEMSAGISGPSGELLKHAALLIPVDPAYDRSQISLVEALDGRQEEEPFLNCPARDAIAS